MLFCPSSTAVTAGACSRTSKFSLWIIVPAIPGLWPCQLGFMGDAVHSHRGAPDFQLWVQSLLPVRSTMLWGIAGQLMCGLVGSSYCPCPLSPSSPLLVLLTEMTAREVMRSEAFFFSQPGPMGSYFLTPPAPKWLFTPEKGELEKGVFKHLDEFPPSPSHLPQTLTANT